MGVDTSGLRTDSAGRPKLGDAGGVGHTGSAVRVHDADPARDDAVVRDESGDWATRAAPYLPVHWALIKEGQAVALCTQGAGEYTVVTWDLTFLSCPRCKENLG